MRSVLTKIDLPASEDGHRRVLDRMEGDPAPPSAPATARDSPCRGRARPNPRSARDLPGVVLRMEPKDGVRRIASWEVAASTIFEQREIRNFRMGRRRHCLILLTSLLAATVSEAAVASSWLHSASTRDPLPASRASLKGKIAYTAPGGDLWTMNADGSQRRRLTRSRFGVDYSPSWSPSGKRIVFRTDRGRYVHVAGGTGASGIFVISSDGSHERQIQPRTGGLFPAWEPNGTKIAFSGVTTKGDGVFLMNPDGSGKQNLHTITAAAECTTWSRDSTKIAFCGHNGDGNWAVWVMNADGSKQRQLTTPVLVEPAGTGGDYPASFSPDGKELLFSSGQHGGREIYTINLDGTGRRRLTNWNGADGASAWLPDGRIVFAHYTGDAARPRWYVMDAGGDNIRSLPILDKVRAGDPIAWWTSNP